MWKMVQQVRQAIEQLLELFLFIFHVICTYAYHWGCVCVCVTSWTKIIIVQRKMEYEEMFTANNWIKRWCCWCVLFVTCPSFLILVVIWSIGMVHIFISQIRTVHSICSCGLPLIYGRIAIVLNVQSLGELISKKKQEATTSPLFVQIAAKEITSNLMKLLWHN